MAPAKRKRRKSTRVGVRESGSPAYGRPRCFVIAGSNGAGKTTFAQEYLPHEAGTIHFVNADIIASQLSPGDPSRAGVAAARVVLTELERLVAAREDFAFESTLSGHAYAARLKRWKAHGYFVKIVYLTLGSPDLALERISARVRQGGHNIPKQDVLRRFERSIENFESLYKPLADAWELYDNAGRQPRLLQVGP